MLVVVISTVNLFWVVPQTEEGRVGCKTFFTQQAVDETHLYYNPIRKTIEVYPLGVHVFY